MDGFDSLDLAAALSSPLTFGLLVGLAVYLLWMAATALRSPAGQYQDRLAGYVGAQKGRARPPRPPLSVALRRTIHVLGRYTPKSNWAKTEERLQKAGRPGNLSVLDFMGLRLLMLLLLGGGSFFLMAVSQPFAVALRNALVAALIGYLLPSFWLGRAARKRQHQILRALPDVLDMLTIGVEAGLAFESALLRVSQKWDNALTREFRRVVSEMRVGTGRDEALQRMAARVAVDEISAFVAVLVQSNQLGISIAQVLNSQAEQMRLKRRQMAEETARQASVKIVMVVVFLIFPSIFVVVLGPAFPRIMTLLTGATSGIGG